MVKNSRVQTMRAIVDCEDDTKGMSVKYYVATWFGTKHWLANIQASQKFGWLPTYFVQFLATNQSFQTLKQKCSDGAKYYIGNYSEESTCLENT